MLPAKREKTMGLAALNVATAAMCLLMAWYAGSEESGVIQWTLSIVALLSATMALILLIRSWRLNGTPGGTSADDNDESADTEDNSDSPTERADRSQTDSERAPLGRILSSMGEAVIVTKPDGYIEYANAAAHSLVKADDGSLTGTHIKDVLDNDDAKSLTKKSAAKPQEGALRATDGSPVFVSYMVSELLDDSGEIESLIYTAQNVDDRKRVEQRIRYLARTDPLTKMANRMQFQHYLQQGIARARRSRQYLALLYMDVDRFKDINDTFGHAAGDAALEIFSQRMLDQLPEKAIPGRLAGDEFAVLVTGYETMDGLHSELNQLAENLLTAIGKPFKVQGEEIFMTTSIGVGIYPRDGDNVIDLIRNADAALYHAKKAGGNCIEYYSPDMNVESVERLMLKSKLRRAFEQDELRLHYQPKYGLRSGRIEGAEALIRWDQPDHGLLFPSDFIPLAEETNLIIQVGDWVLDRVCADYRIWQRTVPSPCRVSINLSLRQLQQRRFLEKVRETFESHGVSPTCLELEITETTLMEDTDRTIKILDSLYGMGLHLAIDDFGTGYSSLSALQQFPINTLKIDRSFVEDVAIDKDNASIVRAIIQMGHSLGLEVVAEGVESEDQLAFLRAENCDYAQGHLFGDPMTGNEFCSVLSSDHEGTGKYRTLFG